MKVKNIVLGVQPKEHFFKNLEQDWEDLKEGKDFQDREEVYFESIEAFRKVLTPLRLHVF